MTQNQVKDLRNLYDSLWQAAIPVISHGEIQIDPCLNDRQNDHRLGLTVIARPDEKVSRKITAFLESLIQIESDQHYYLPSEYHLTVLSLFTATEQHQPYFALNALYSAAVREALSQAKQFTISFQGITATDSAIMVQGFPQDDCLEQLRQGLRRTLRQRGLGAGLDERYRIKTAHVTAVRFRMPLSNPARLLACLQDYRHYTFGQTTFHNLYLVKNDWYMSQDKVEEIEAFPLTRLSV